MQEDAMQTSHILIAGFVALGACASGGGGWSASSWNGLDERLIETRNYQYLAAPMDGQGFKLKFTLKTDGSFRPQAAGAPPPFAELEEAAQAAAPAGCTFLTIEIAADASAVAAYECS
jgi:hypothetical protein